MDWEETKPSSAATAVVGETLDTMSVEELRLRIEVLRAEISRVEAEITKKETHQARASSVFKS